MGGEKLSVCPKKVGNIGGKKAVWDAVCVCEDARSSSLRLKIWAITSDTINNGNVSPYHYFFT